MHSKMAVKDLPGTNCFYVTLHPSFKLKGYLDSLKSRFCYYTLSHNSLKKNDSIGQSHKLLIDKILPKISLIVSHLPEVQSA